jgi:hypothetical protein
MLKAHCLTVTMPACAAVSATGLVLPGVSGSIAPSVPATNFSTMAPGRMRFVSPTSVRA